MEPGRAVRGDQDREGLDVSHVLSFNVADDSRDADRKPSHISVFHSYSPGSILQLLPSNSPASVARFLALQPHLPPPSQRLMYSPLSPSPTSTPVNPGDGGSTSAAPAEPHQNLPLTLLELLRDHLDLSAVPRRSFFQWMRCFTEDEREQERLDEFLHLEDGGVSRSNPPCVVAMGVGH